MYSETTVSNLVAVLVERDPRPLLELLDRPFRSDATYETRREDFSLADASRNFLDVAFYENQIPLAALELKVGAGWHGDQASRYEDWANETKADPRLLFLTPLGLDYGESESWTRLTLGDFFSGWSESDDQLARLLSEEMRRETLRWTQDLPNTRLSSLPSRTDAIMALRLVSNTLLTTQWAASVALQAGEHFTINGPNPATYHWAAHPDPALVDTFLEVDIRSGSSDKSPWQVRVGVDVEPVLTATQLEGLLSAPRVAEAQSRFDAACAAERNSASVTPNSAVAKARRSAAKELKSATTSLNAERGALRTELGAPRSRQLAQAVLGGWSIDQIREELSDAGLPGIANAIILPTSAHRLRGLKTKHEFYLDLGGRQRFIMFEIAPEDIEARQIGDLIVWALDALRSRAACQSDTAHVASALTAEDIRDLPAG